MPRGYKKCCGCHLEKEATQYNFPPNKRSPDGCGWECKECRKKRRNSPEYKLKRKKAYQHRQLRLGIIRRRRRSRFKTKEEERENDLNNWYKRRYGISTQEYNVLLENQDGNCAICGKKENKKRLSVDHSHKTNRIRGLLCGSCNRAIGLLHDDIKLLDNAIEYLKNNN